MKKRIRCLGSFVNITLAEEPYSFRDLFPQGIAGLEGSKHCRGFFF